ncbi:hypothetical protein ACWDYH_33680 [Nocardia goodfellowii]|uniref:Uncharacterized protein n=1 Tax=Nocardia goodfellowii TaxID=882446 RepID=A0ABS4QL05_9NOCA|nr:hypothetical protein [Nocardia goodfellowii]MBP2192389.1 hypothetical protein [Nocardia goodfellowii]
MVDITAFDVLAQISKSSPEAPPVAEQLQQMLSYLTWLVLGSGIAAIVFAAARFAWEKWTGSWLESPKMVAGAMIGGLLATSAGTIMNTLLT